MGRRVRRPVDRHGDASPDAPTFAALFLVLRDTVQREGAAVLPNAELYGWVLDAFARDVARQGEVRSLGVGAVAPDVPSLDTTETTPVPACGNRLEEILACRDMTKAELARRINVARFTLTKIARGSRPGYDLAHAIARELDADVTTLFPPRFAAFGPHRKEERKRGRHRRTRSE